MSIFLTRAQLLIEQERFAMAEKELYNEISESPDNPVAHALLALCLSHQKKYAQAIQEASLSIGLAPDLSLCHYVYAVVLYEQQQLTKAEIAVNEALSLDSWHPEYYALLASLKLQQKKWQEALEISEQGLKIEPENIECINLRGLALTKLGFKREAISSIESALARDPENAFTHANQGWNFLEQGEHKKSLEHFQEALRLEPNLEFAREGIVVSLKAKNIIYRLLLRYIFWMSKLSSKNQWIFIIGLIFGIKILRELSKVFPDFAPVFMSIIVLYFIFVFLVWTAEPLFNLLLRLDKLGRFALSEEQIFTSNLLGLLLSGAAISFTIFLISLFTPAIESDTPLIASIYFSLMILPTSGTFAGKSPRGKKILGFYTIALGITGALAIIAYSATMGGFATLSLFFIFGFVLFTWLANFIH